MNLRLSGYEPDELPGCSTPRPCDFLIPQKNLKCKFLCKPQKLLTLDLISEPGKIKTMPGKGKILIAKPGLDGHDRGAKVVARALRDAGYEVIYTGLHQTPEMIVQTAIDEDVDAIGVSILSGAHNTIFPEIIRLMKNAGLDDVILFGGGIIPDDDIPKLKEMGVREIFTPGTSLKSIISFVDQVIKEKKEKEKKG